MRWVLLRYQLVSAAQQGITVLLTARPYALHAQLVISVLLLAQSVALLNALLVLTQTLRPLLPVA